MSTELQLGKLKKFYRWIHKNVDMLDATEYFKMVNYVTYILLQWKENFQKRFLASLITNTGSLQFPWETPYDPPKHYITKNSLQIEFTERN